MALSFGRPRFAAQKPSGGTWTHVLGEEPLGFRKGFRTRQPATEGKRKPLVQDSGRNSRPLPRKPKETTPRLPPFSSSCWSFWEIRNMSCRNSVPVNQGKQIRLLKPAMWASENEFASPDFNMKAKETMPLLGYSGTPKKNNPGDLIATKDEISGTGKHISCIVTRKVTSEHGTVWAQNPSNISIATFKQPQTSSAYCVPVTGQQKAWPA